MTSAGIPDDLIELLKQDHRLVEFRLAEAEKSGPTTRAELFWKLTNDLVRHEVAEEIVVYPLLRKLPGGTHVADVRIAEQSQAEQRLADMEKMDPTSPEFAAGLAALKTAVLDHARAEEESAFVMLGRDLLLDQQIELGRRYTRAKDAAPNHPHPHAPDTPPGNVLVGPVAALVDRIRDAASTV